MSDNGGIQRVNQVDTQDYLRQNDLLAGGRLRLGLYNLARIG
jgi:hypothetical protein